MRNILQSSNENILCLQMKVHYNQMEASQGQVETKVSEFVIHEMYRFIQTAKIRLNKIEVFGRLVRNNRRGIEFNHHNPAFVAEIFMEEKQFNHIIFEVDKLTSQLTFKYQSNCNSLEAAEIVLRQIQSYVIRMASKVLTFLELMGIHRTSNDCFSKYFLELKDGLNSSIKTILSDTSVAPMGGESNFGNHCQKWHADVDLQLISTEKKVTKGGYFDVEKVCCNYLKKQRIFARKSFKSDSDESHLCKLKREEIAIKSIKNHKYIVNYYQPCQPPKRAENISQKIAKPVIFMEYFQSNLKEFLRQNLSLSHTDCLNLSFQVIESVMNLHASGIVHRDIKPANFLIRKTNQGQYILKIIDFAESYVPQFKEYEGKKINILDVGCTPPYSPIECSQRKDRPQISLMSPAIDAWSVGMIIYEIFFRKHPVNFSRPMVSDIIGGWPEELLIAVNQRTKFGVSLVEEYVSVLCSRLLVHDQSQRMKLNQAKRIVEQLSKFVFKLEKNCLCSIDFKNVDSTRETKVKYLISSINI